VVERSLPPYLFHPCVPLWREDWYSRIATGFAVWAVAVVDLGREIELGEKAWEAAGSVLPAALDLELWGALDSEGRDVLGSELGGCDITILPDSVLPVTLDLGVREECGGSEVPVALDP
jgi:hypothetical protein